LSLWTFETRIDATTVFKTTQQEKKKRGVEAFFLCWLNSFYREQSAASASSRNDPRSRLGGS
jgi:hypothetical protein